MMALNSIQSSYLRLSVALLVVLAATGYIVLDGLPSLHSQRQAIDQLRASLVVKRQQAENVQIASTQLTELQTQQTQLDQEIWKFVDEQHFFGLWPTLAASTGLSISAPIVSDAVPGKNLVTRTVEVTMTGPLANIWSGLAAIQALSPAVGITSLDLEPATSPEQVSATVQAQTIWQ